jgi:hypothetical protein
MPRTLAFKDEPGRRFHYGAILHMDEIGWSSPKDVEPGEPTNRIIDENGRERRIISLEEMHEVASMVC